MAVDLLLVLFLHAKNNLRRYDAFVRILELDVRIQCKGGRIFKQMGGYFFVVYGVFHVVSGLVNT